MINIDSSYIRRVYLVSGILTISAFLYAQHVYAINTAIGILAGGFFGVVNMMLLERVVRDYITPDQRDLGQISIALIFKFPVAIGILLLSFYKGWVNLLGFAVGFTIFVLSIILTLFIFYESSNRKKLMEGKEKP